MTERLLRLALVVASLAVLCWHPVLAFVHTVGRWLSRQADELEVSYLLARADRKTRQAEAARRGRGSL